MIVIGLDPSTKTGYSIENASTGLGVRGEVEFARFKGMERVTAFQNWWLGILEKYPPALVAIEGYGYANTHSLVPLVEIGTVFRLGAYQKGIELVEVPPTSLKKFATGSGNAQKDSVMLAVYKTWGIEPRTNNEADAIVLSKMAMALKSGQELPWLTKARQEVLGNMGKKK